MKTGFLGIPTGLRKRLFDIAGFARENNISVYIVGGVVRDLLLKKTIKDLDLVIEGDASGFTRRYLRGSGCKKINLTVHPVFKTATLRFSDGHVVDVASAREEVYPRPGALPVVRLGTLEDDLCRRDFTINALAAAVNRNGSGELIDYFDGKKDLRRKAVRILHDRSFVDDPTRILRAVRFEQRLGFRIEPRTRRLLQAAVRKKAYETVKPPRYFAEFRKIFDESDPVKILRRLRQLKATEPFCLGAKLNLRRLAMVQRYLKTTSGTPGQCLFWMALWENYPAAEREEMAGRFHLTRAEKSVLMKAPEAVQVIRRVSRIGKSKDLFRCLKNYDIPVLYYAQARTASRKVRVRIGHFLQTDRHCKLAVNGHDLRKLGVTSGHWIGKILEELLEKKVSGRLKTRAQEMREARELADRVMR